MLKEVSQKLAYTSLVDMSIVVPFKEIRKNRFESEHKEISSGHGECVVQFNHASGDKSIRCGHL